eukprot:6946833-Lingulodinium_polyedra.AAC.1
MGLFIGWDCAGVIRLGWAMVRVIKPAAGLDAPSIIFADHTESAVAQLRPLVDGQADPLPREQGP